MNKKILITVITFLTLSGFALGQNSRVLSLGGMTYSISDHDYSLGLYDFGKNPAWLINDEKTTYLKMMPGFNRIWGDYKRVYDFGSSELYSMGFKGIKTLGTKGTFLGYTAYNYEQRNDVYKTLKHDTYAGEAFYSIDSTTGNFRYNGPSVGFSYSFELLPDLFAGATVDYGIMDGLKNIYSSAKSLLRNIDGQAGLAYRFSENFILGSTVYLMDDQESLEMRSIDGTDVEIFNYRGDTYSTKIRKPTLNQKVRKKEKGAGAQLYLNPISDMEIAATGDYNVASTSIFIPNGDIKEFEEGHAAFENFRMNMKAKYMVNENLQLGAIANYYSNYSWSKNPSRNLLLWEWKLSGPTFGAGGSYYISSIKLLVGAEFELSTIKADSSKYVDTKFLKITSNNNIMRLGLEYEVSEGTFIRAGYDNGTDEYDFINGGQDVKTNFVTLGCGYKVSDLINIDLGIQYGNLSPKNYNNYRRDKFNLLATVKILSF